MELPNELYCKIFEFIFDKNQIIYLKGIDLNLEDIDLFNKTFLYHENLQNEFLEKTKFWKINWLNKEQDFSQPLSYESTESGACAYENSLSSLNYIVYYWNYTFPNYYNEHSERPKKDYCEKEYITDYNKNTKKIVYNLKMLKKYEWDSTTKRLWKPKNK